MFDVSQDQNISLPEVQKMMIGVYKVLSDLNLQSFEKEDAKKYGEELFELLDENKTGSVNFEQFKKIIPTITHKVKGLGRLEGASKTLKNVAPGDTVLWGSKSWTTAFEMMIVI